MARARRTTRRDGGFTLLELLVAMTLLSLLVVMLFAGLRFGARVWDGGTASSERIADIRLTQEFLRRQIEQAWQSSSGLSSSSPSEEPVARFDGDLERVSFVAPWPSRQDAARLYRHDLYLSDGDLLLSLTPHHSPGDRSPEARVKTLLQDVREVAFGYYGRDEEDAPPRWRPTWTDRPRLPDLVQLRLSFGARGYGKGNSDGRTWPDLVIVPRRNADF